MRHWQRDTDFTGVGGPAALAKLPEAERQQWQQFWADVAATLAQARERYEELRKRKLALPVGLPIGLPLVNLPVPGRRKPKDDGDSDADDPVVEERPTT